MSETLKPLDEQIRERVVLLPADLQAQVLNFVLFLRYKQAKEGHLPITQELIGALAESGFDESDYKKYLENKYK